MKTSECSQGREFGASWQFWGKICLWIWSDSNNNSQDHCETFWEGIVDFFFLSFLFFPPEEKPLSDWNITLAGGRLPIKESPSEGAGGAAGAGCSVRAGAGFRVVMGPSAPPGAAAARPGARDSPQLLLFNRGTVSFPAPLALGSLGWWRTRCLYLLGAKISSVTKESLTTHLCKSLSNAAPPMARAAGKLRQTRLCPPTQRLWVACTCVTILVAAQSTVTFGFPNSSFPRITWIMSKTSNV